MTHVGYPKSPRGLGRLWGVTQSGVGTGGMSQPRVRNPEGRESSQVRGVVDEPIEYVRGN